MQSAIRQADMKGAMSRLIILIISLLSWGAASSSEWLPESPVSFYETELQRTTLFQSTRLASLTGNVILDSSEPPPERPYGYGRELGDTSPADYPGLRKDAGYFFGYQFFIVGLLYVLPEEISAWTDEQKEEYTVNKWWDNVTHPRWDPDEWYINYILHPYWGMTYYTRGRERGLSETGAFWYSFTLSSIYEFGLEALFEPVSIQDMIFTPGLGSLLGWYFEDTRREIKSQSSYSFWDQTVLVLTDPLGTLNTIVDGWIETDSELELRSFYRSPSFGIYDDRDWNSPYRQRIDPLVNDYLGLQLTVHWQ
ncbi:MAG: DUF3943 domain-containing protein [Candidatus Thiodiazotropha taylori]|nr:DUF3943 domain-containing protein [Candidatus Thiodiazotropha taylori]